MKVYYSSCIDLKSERGNSRGSDKSYVRKRTYPKTPNASCRRSQSLLDWQLLNDNLMIRIILLINVARILLISKWKLRISKVVWHTVHRKFNENGAAIGTQKGYFRQKLPGLRLGISELEPCFSGNFRQKLLGLRLGISEDCELDWSPWIFWWKFPEKFGTNSDIRKWNPSNFWRKFPEKFGSNPEIPEWSDRYPKGLPLR